MRRIIFTVVSTPTSDVISTSSTSSSRSAIDRRAACYGTGEFREDSGLGLFEPRVKLFLLLLPALRNVRCGAILFLFEIIENTHYLYLYILTKIIRKFR